MGLRLGSIGLVMAAMLLGACQIGTGGKVEVKGVEYTYTYAFQNLQRIVSISPEGELTVEQVQGNSRARGKMQLSDDERRKVAEAFKDWKSLKPTYQVIFGPVMSIAYDGYKVESSGSSDVPANFLKAKELLDSLAEEAVAKSAATSSAPATQR